MGKMAWDGPKWGQDNFFATNPDLADILGRMDLDFENFHFFSDSNFPDFQVPRFPNFQIPIFLDAGGDDDGQILRSQPDLSQRTQGSNMSQGALAAIVSL